MIKYLNLLKVDEVVFNWLVQVGRLKENKDVCVDLKYFDETIEKINKYRKKYRNSSIAPIFLQHKMSKYFLFIITYPPSPNEY